MLALRADWQRHLRRAHNELGFGHVRFHDLLSDDMGTLMDEQNKLIYEFFNADQIFDFLLSIGMKPFVELSFMPTTLSSGNTTVFHYNANVTPPKDYGAWGTLISRLTSHWVERYGIEEVRTWFFEVWNEPNPAGFLDRNTAGLLPSLPESPPKRSRTSTRPSRLEGPATAGNAWISEFLNFCDNNHVSADFISTHHYPTDDLGTIGEDTETQLSHSKPSILRDWAQET